MKYSVIRVWVFAGVKGMRLLTEVVDRCFFGGGREMSSQQSDYI